MNGVRAFGMHGRTKNPAVEIEAEPAKLTGDDWRRLEAFLLTTEDERRVMRAPITPTTDDVDHSEPNDVP